VIWVRSLVRTQAFPANLQTEPPEPFHPCSGTPFLFDSSRPLVLVPDSPFTRDLKAYLSQNVPESAEACFNPNGILLNNSVQPILDEIQDPRYDKNPREYVAMVVFSETGPKRFDYAIRASSSDIPNTNRVNDPFLGDFSDSPNFARYTSSVTARLQMAVDEFIVGRTLGQSEITAGSILNYGFSDMPYASYIDDDFFVIVDTGFVLLFIFAWLWPFTRFVKLVMEETESKLREGMKMMGLTDSAFWGSWFLTYLIIFLIIDTYLTAMMASRVYVNSSPLAVFVFFISFQLSIIALGILFSSILKTPRSAIYMSVLTFLGGWMVYVLAANPANDVSVSARMGLCVISPICLGFTSQTFSAAEQVIGDERGITLSSWWNGRDDLSFGQASSMMILDAVVYLILAWYFDKVIKSENGEKMPWYFPFLPSYWFPRASPSKQSLLTDMDDDEKVYYANDFYESVDPELSKKDGIIIKKLRRQFPGSEGKPFVAVNDLYLRMYEGEVFVLLGHNGAGKTTTISMLTGLLSMTEGHVSIFGLDLRTQLNEIHKIIGVCPQKNILFPELTVSEHLVMFAAFKQIPKASVDLAVKEAIHAVGLTEKTNVQSQLLSGGQKRKLCLAIAFLGNPKVVFLDEPTSGMDVDSRRAIWQIIKSQKKGKVIILTTHFMDEADLLGDRIGIMAKGQLVCMGTSLFLKSKYGVGYTFVVTMEENEPVSKKAVENVIVSNCGDKVSVLNNIGREMFFRIPMSASKSFPSMFRELESRKDEYKVQNYTVSATTLEEVFLKVGNEEDIIPGQKLGTEGGDNAVEMKEITSGNEEKAQISQLMKQSGTIATKSPFIIFFTHFYALIVKRFHYARRDWGSVCCLWILPIFFILLGLYLYNGIFVTNFNPYTLDLNLYGNSEIIPYFQESGSLPISSHLPAGASTLPLSLTNNNFSLILSLPSDEMANMIQEVRKEIGKQLVDLTQDRSKSISGSIIAISVPDLPPASFWVYIRQTAIHGIPTYANLLTNAFLKATTLDTQYSIRTTFEPFPLTAEENNINELTQGFFFTIFITVAFSFVPASIITFVVQERFVKSKHQQMISGVSIPVYWISNYCWDIITYMILYCLTLAAFEVTGLDALTGGGRLKGTAAVFFLFGLSIIGWTYCISFFFKGPQTARVAALILGLITGILLLVAGQFLTSTTTWGHRLLRFFRIFPMYALAESLINIPSSFFLEKGVFDKDVTGTNLTYLGVSSILYLALAIAIEYLLTLPGLTTFVKAKLGMEPRVADAPVSEDDDVLAEKQKMQSATISDDPVQVRGLRKVFVGPQGPKVAVRDLWYSIPKGECFGFLGINGAGKTTTLSILSGDLYPSSGGAKLGGFDILTEQLQLRRLIGYCPQFDALFDKLTGKEHLEFYARIKGVPSQKIPGIVDGMLHYFTLDPYKNRTSEKYSGGNKRKLSVAMALMGDPQIVFLDEPSSGMDPVSRRFMWKFIAETMEGRAVILTTHAMEECEALCARIGIMVDGRLRCLGTPQHIKNKFGQGFQLDTIAPLENVDEVKESLPKLLSEVASEVQLVEAYGMSVKFRVVLSAAKSLADLFEIMETSSGSAHVREYSISQTTLEQVFIQFAKQQQNYEAP